MQRRIIMVDLDSIIRDTKYMYYDKTGTAIVTLVD